MPFAVAVGPSDRARARQMSLALAAGCYGVWFAALLAAPYVPWWCLPFLLGLPLGLHSSLQHEAIHGHMGRLGEALMMVPLGLWCPYPCFKASHLRHHESPLTDPRDDPESFLVSRAGWQRLGPVRRALAWVNMTLAGRLTLGFWMRVGRYLLWSAGRILRGEPGIRAMWAMHGAGVALVLGVAWQAGGVDPLTYLLAGVWPGTALLFLRSFLEHHPAADPDARTGVVEAGPLMVILFLGNNYHWLHHARPDLPWPMLRQHWQAMRAEVIARNGGYYYPGGYGEVLARHLARPFMHPCHPDAEG